MYTAYLHCPSGRREHIDGCDYGRPLVQQVLGDWREGDMSSYHVSITDEDGVLATMIGSSDEVFVTFRDGLCERHTFDEYGKPVLRHAHQMR